MKPALGPEMLNRYNLQNSVTINAMTAPGVSEFSAIEALTAISQRSLPIGYSYAWSGITYQSLAAGNLAPIIFSLALIGAETASRVSMGVAVFFGILASSILGTQMVPAAFAAVQRFREWLKGSFRSS